MLRKKQKSEVFPRYKFNLTIFPFLVGKSGEKSFQVFEWVVLFILS